MKNKFSQIFNLSGIDSRLSFSLIKFLAVPLSHVLFICGAYLEISLFGALQNINMVIHSKGGKLKVQLKSWESSKTEWGKKYRETWHPTPREIIFSSLEEIKECWFWSFTSWILIQILVCYEIWFHIVIFSFIFRVYVQKVKSALCIFFQPKTTLQYVIAIICIPLCPGLCTIFFWPFFIVSLCRKGTEDTQNNL